MRPSLDFKAPLAQLQLRAAAELEARARARAADRDSRSSIAARAEKSLHAFFTDFAWPVLYPGVRFEDNWHIHAICEHLEAVSAGQIKKLCISMPFRMLKSSIVSQAWPAWEWIPRSWLQYLTASYQKDLATRDAVYSRRIIESTNYQYWFGDRFAMTTDQNVKQRYENDHGGHRIVTSTDSSGTGFGGHRRIIDDPVGARQADSAVALDASIEFWKGTMATRANDPANDAVVIVHQRLNERDLTGYVLAEESGWDHLVLPMRYSREFAKTTSIGFHDPRTVEGELLHPARVPESTVKDLVKTLGQYHADAQLDQRPMPRGGIIFKRDNWKFYKVLPALDEKILSIDATFKSTAGSDFVAIHVWGRKGANKYLLRRLKERMGFAATVAAVKSMHAIHHDAIAVLIEDKANGPAVIETLTSEIPAVFAVNPQGGKLARAYAMQPEHEAGNIWLPDPSIEPEIEVFLSEATTFDGLGTKHDDEVDAMTQAVNWWRMRLGATGLLDYMQQEADREAAARPKTNGASVHYGEHESGGDNPAMNGPYAAPLPSPDEQIAAMLETPAWDQRAA